MPYALKLHKPINFEDYTLILPSISVGNVPQLAIDVIISTYKFKNAGIIYHPAFIPIAGWNMDSPNDGLEVTTACELYTLVTSKIAVLQIRSGTQPCRTKQFIQDLRKIIISCKFKESIILTTAFSYEIHDLKSNLFHYSGNFDAFKNPISQLHDNHALSGSGYANALLSVLIQVTRCILVVQYISEGDNTADALQMVDFLRRNLTPMNKLSNKVEMLVPWQYVYGKSAPVILY